MYTIHLIKALLKKIVYIYMVDKKFEV